MNLYGDLDNHNRVQVKAEDRGEEMELWTLHCV